MNKITVSSSLGPSFIDRICLPHWKKTDGTEDANVNLNVKTIVTRCPFLHSASICFLLPSLLYAKKCSTLVAHNSFLVIVIPKLVNQSSLHWQAFHHHHSILFSASNPNVRWSFWRSTTGRMAFYVHGPLVLVHFVKVATNNEH